MNTLKKSLVVALLALFTQQTQAQIYEKGSSQINLGIGLISTVRVTGSNTIIPPVGVSYEYGFHKNISGGVYAGYSGSRSETHWGGNKFVYKYNYLIVGARASYHFDFDFINTEKFDPYAGVIIGTNIASSSVETPSGYVGPKPTPASAGGVVIGAFAGMRYHINPNFGFFAEVGNSVSFIQAGITSKF
jgi:hypothetical protein